MAVQDDGMGGFVPEEPAPYNPAGESFDPGYIGGGPGAQVASDDQYGVGHFDIGGTLFEYPATPPPQSMGDDPWGRTTAAEDEAGRQASQDFWRPLGDLWGDLMGSEAVQKSLGEIEKAHSITTGGLGNIAAGLENLRNWGVQTAQDVFGGGGQAQVGTQVNDAWNAAAALKHSEDLASGVDTSDPWYQVKLMMDAGKAAWGVVDPQIPVAKGAIEALADPTNLLTAGGGAALGLAKGLGKGAGKKSIKEAAAGGASKIDAAAHADDLTRLAESAKKVSEGKGSIQDVTAVRDARMVADDLEASGRPDKAQSIRDLLEGTTAPSTVGGRNAPMVERGRLTKEGADTVMGRGQKPAGAPNQGVGAGLRARMGKTADEFADVGPKQQASNKAFADEVASREAQKLAKERDTSLRGVGVKYEDLSDAAKKRVDNMYGIGITDPAESTLNKILSPISNVTNVMRTFMTSWDISMGRQASGLVGGAPRSVAKGFASQWDSKSFTEDVWKQETAKIVKEVDDYGGMEAGLQLTGIGAFQEEKYIASGFIEKVPGVRGSEMIYTHGLNVTRADAYVTGVKSMEAAAGRKLTDEERKQFASHINHLSGRGDVPVGAQKAFDTINGIFFAPRYRLSRAQVATDFAGAAGSVIKDVAAGIKSGALKRGELELNPVDLKVLEFTGKYVASIESIMRAAALGNKITGGDDSYTSLGFETPGTKVDPTGATFGSIDVGKPGGPGAMGAAALEIVGGGSNTYARGRGEPTTKVNIWSGFSTELRTLIREFRNLQGLLADFGVGDKPKGARTPGEDFLDWMRQGFTPSADLIEQIRTGENAIGGKVPKESFRSINPLENPLTGSFAPLGLGNAAEALGASTKGGPYIGGPPSKKGKGWAD